MSLRPTLLPKELERPLLGLVARLAQTCQRLLPSRILPATNNAPLLVLHQVLPGEPTTGVLGGSVEHLGLGSHSRNTAPTTAHCSAAATASATAAHGCAASTLVTSTAHLI